MMKNKAQIMGAGLIALLLALAGCANPLGEGPETSSPKAVSGGKIVVTLGGLDARTLGPIAEDVAGLQYRLVIQNSAKIIEEDIEDFSQPVERSIEPGYWTIGVLAYTEGNKTAWGSVSSVSVLEGETRTVPITLLPVTDEDAAGIFDYDIAFPEPTNDFDYSSTILRLDPVQYGNSSDTYTITINLRDFDKKAAKLELPAGKYNLDILLQSTRRVNGEALKVVVKEVVYLYPGLTTQAHYPFTEAHFAAEVYLKGRAYVDNQTTLDANDNLIHQYSPTEVQLRLVDGSFETAPITFNTETYTYEWELLVSSEKLGGAYNASTVWLSFIAASESDPEQTLTSNEQNFSIGIQGNTNISLYTTIYSIAKDTLNTYFAGIEGVSGIAHHSDAVAGSYVRLKIIPLNKYGLIGNSVSVSGVPHYPDPDGTVGFTMPFWSSTVNANFFHLAGTAYISNANPFNYAPNSIVAYEELWDDTELAYVQQQIGSTGSIAVNGAWEIPVPADYIATTGTIYFKIISKAAGQADQEYTLSSDPYYLTGTSEVTLPVPLFTLNNVRTESNATSITIHWDAASWATGYRIYRYESGDYELIDSPAAAATSYIDEIAPGVYNYKIVGVYGAPPAEGEPVYFTGISGIIAPENVTAATAANRNYPFQTTVSWEPVANAEGYYVYRNGSYLNSSWGTSYSDTSAKTIGETYAYSVVAYNTMYSITSGYSDTATVSFSVTDSLPLNYLYYGSIDVQGEFDCYNFYAPSDGTYYLTLDDSDNYSGLVDAYLYLYDQWGNLMYFFDSGTYGYYLNYGSWYVVVVPYSTGTGNYRVIVSQ